jgi:hypothetical protein
MEKIKHFLWFSAKVLLAIIIINAVLSFFGTTAQAIVTNPIGFVKGFFSKPATPAGS